MQSRQQPQQRAIQQLPPSTALGVQGGYSVHGFAQAVEQVCANSIDAGARNVAVHFDAAQLVATVSDDGIGIPAASFPSLGVRFCSSKAAGSACSSARLGGQAAAAAHVTSAAGASQPTLTHDSGTLGFRGVFLASLAEVARVEIVSKATGAFETHRKVLQCPESHLHAVWNLLRAV